MHERAALTHTYARLLSKWDKREAAGRDMAQLIEVAALDQKLRVLGHDSAVEFNKKLLKRMHDERKSMF